MRNEFAHNISHLHFVAVGLLLYMTLLALDPVPKPLSYVYRIFLIVGVAVSHVLLGIPIMMGTQVIAYDYYAALGRDWGPSLLADQQLGGSLLWLLGDVTTLTFLIGVVVQWVRSDAREARRVGRQLDRIHGGGATMTPWWETSGEEDRHPR